MTVKDMLETRDHEVWSITSNTTVFDAIAVMAEKEVGALPVVDDGKMVGIVSERDYARKVILQKKSSVDTTAADVMTRDVICVSEDTEADRCMALMSRYKIRHLPVKTGEKLTGMLSVGDLLKYVIREQQHAIEELESYIMDETGGSG